MNFLKYSNVNCVFNSARQDCFLIYTIGRRSLQQHITLKRPFNLSPALRIPNMERESVLTVVYIILVFISVLTTSAPAKDRNAFKTESFELFSTSSEDWRYQRKIQHQNLTTTFQQVTITNTLNTESKGRSNNNPWIFNRANQSNNLDYYYNSDDYYYDYDEYYVFDCIDHGYPASEPCCSWNCPGDVEFDTYIRTCNCDDMCHIYDDCCVSKSINSDKNIKIPNVSFDCLYIPRIYDQWFVFIVNNCQDGTSYDLQTLCTAPDEQNIYSDTPATSFGTRVLYRNMYCAMCNGVEDFVLWKAVLRCHWLGNEEAKFGNLSIDELYLRDECFLFYKEPFVKSYRRCYPAISSCPDTSTERSTLSDHKGVNVTSCENGGNRYLYTPDNIYKNPDCYECNKGNSTEEASCHYYDFDAKHIYGEFSHRFTLNFYFDLSTHQSILTRYMYKTNTTVEQVSFIGRCGPMEAYDPFHGECKKVCITSDSNCTSSIIKIRNDTPEYDSYEYNYDVKSNVNFWHSYLEDYYLIRDRAVFDYKDFEGDCLQFWTCNGTASTNSSSPFCSCDHLCGVYRDCCRDIDASSYDDVMEPSFSCSYIPRIYDNWFIFVVNSCPEETEYELKRLCTEIDEHNVYSSTPASGEITGFLYRNMYCAVCNGIYDYVFWIPQLRCKWKHSENPKLRYLKIEELYLWDECSFFYVPPKPNIEYRQCYPQVSACPVKSEASTTLQYSKDYKCKNGGNKYVATSNNIYKNPDCYECNRGVNTSEDNATCSFRQYALNRVKRITIIRYGGSYTLNMLFDLSTRQSYITRDNNDQLVEIASFVDRCGHGEAYDPFIGDCKIFCDARFDACTGSLGQVQDNVSTCSYVKIKSTDFMLINASVVMHIASGKLYRKFELLEDSVKICVETNSHVKRSKILIQVDNIFHMSTNGISMVSLLATIFIYVKTSFHKLPGKCLLCLSLSLLIAQSMLLVAPVAEDNFAWCKVASFVMHYSFMTSFSWMNVMAFDVYYSFTQHFRQASARGMKWFVKYSIYAWLSPLVIVVAAFLIDEFSAWEYRPKYANPICWINDSTGLLIFFLAPLALILLTNMFFFASSLKNICTSYRTNTEDVKQRKPGQVLIYLKLSAVMGLTWVFGFFGNFVNDEIFWTLFAISNGLQGMYIFLGFAMNPLIKTIQKSKRKIIPCDV